MQHAKTLQRIREQNTRIRKLLAGDLAQTPIANSAWSAMEHLDHTIKVASGILFLLSKDEIPAAPRGINLLGRMVLWMGWIPRGRGRAPEKMLPSPATAGELTQRLAELDALIDRVSARTAAIPRAPIVRHPAFGGLTYAQALRFVTVHTHHHLKILDGARTAAVQNA